MLPVLLYKWIIGLIYSSAGFRNIYTKKSWTKESMTKENMSRQFLWKYFQENMQGIFVS